MKNATSILFKSLVAGSLALAPTAAFAQEVANNNAPVTTAASASVATAPMTVQYIKAVDRTEHDTRTLAADASHNKVAIVVWGGNLALQQEAYNAARDLVGAGIPTAFVVGPDGNGSTNDAQFTVYAASLPHSDAAYGTNYTDRIRSDMRDAGLAAYREAFPQQLAALDIR